MKIAEINKPKKEFIVDKNSWIMKFFIYIRRDGDYHLPTDSCKLRNEMIKSFILFFLAAPMFIITKPLLKLFDDDDDMPSWVPIILTALGFMFISLINIDSGTPWLDTPIYRYLKDFGFTNLNAFLFAWYGLSLLLIAMFALIIMTIIGVVFLLIKFFNLFKNTKPKKEKMINKLYADLREKVCTPVKYK